MCVCVCVCVLRSKAGEAYYAHFTLNLVTRVNISCIPLHNEFKLGTKIMHKTEYQMSQVKLSGLHHALSVAQKYNLIEELISIKQYLYCQYIYFY